MLTDKHHHASIVTVTSQHANVSIWLKAQPQLIAQDTSDKTISVLTCLLSKTIGYTLHYTESFLINRNAFSLHLLQPDTFMHLVRALVFILDIPRNEDFVIRLKRTKVKNVSLFFRFCDYVYCQEVVLFFLPNRC